MRKRQTLSRKSAGALAAVDAANEACRLLLTLGKLLMAGDIPDNPHILDPATRGHIGRIIVFEVSKLDNAIRCLAASSDID